MILVVYKRWRHLAVALIGFALMDLLVLRLSVELPVPEDVLVAPGSGVYHFPAFGIASLSITLWAMVVTLAPAGKSRDAASVAAIVLGVLVVLARAYLGTTYPIAGLYSLLLGSCIAATLLGWLAPEESFPVTYRRGGKSAHLDLEGARTEAVIRAMRDQLGIEVTSLKSFGEEGSGGSTPLLMTTADGTRLFGKILATSHVRADRWYRIGRTALYGRLEDETSFSSVRRLIAYEDYALRLLDDQGFRVAHSFGIVELTPNREYLLVTEFFEGAETLGHAEVTDEVIDGGLELVRRLWDSGLAHRDVKPANLLVVERRAPGDRRLRAPGPPFAVARGRGPREHDARARAQVGSRPRLPTRARVLHARRDRGSVRGRAGDGDPDRAAAVPQGGRTRPDRAVQGAGTRRGRRSRSSAGASAASR